MSRYERQRSLVDQARLKEASVMVVGVGGLGSFSSLHLALAGVGRIIIVDHDVVEESNLNRQVLYREEDIGERKVLVASRRLREVNPEVDVVPVDAKIDDDFEFDGRVDIVVDGLDNMEARYAAEKFSLKRRIPFVFGAVEGYMGVVTFIDSETRKLRDIFHGSTGRRNPEVLSATAGMVASMQALEVMKYLSGRGDLLKNRLLIYDALSTNFTEVML